MKTRKQNKNEQKGIQEAIFTICFLAFIILLIFIMIFGRETTDNFGNKCKGTIIQICSGEMYD